MSFFYEHAKDKVDQLLRKRLVVEELVVSIPRQPKISYFFKGSIVMKHCVILVVTNLRPFSIFNDKNMKPLRKLINLFLNSVLMNK